MIQNFIQFTRRRVTRVERQVRRRRRDTQKFRSSSEYLKFLFIRQIQTCLQMSYIQICTHIHAVQTNAHEKKNFKLKMTNINLKLNSSASVSY